MHQTRQIYFCWISLWSRHRWRNHKHRPDGRTKDSGQVKFGACYSLISLKQHESKQTSQKPIDFVTGAAFCGAALMDAFQAYSFISSRSGIISLLTENWFCCCYITLWSRSSCFSKADEVLSYQTRPSMWLLHVWNQKPETGLLYGKGSGLGDVPDMKPTSTRTSL